MSMTRGERRAMKALMRGVALLMRYKSWEMLRKEATWLFDEERKL